MSNSPSPAAGGRALVPTLALGAFSIAASEFVSMSLLPEFSRALQVDLPEGSRAISAYALGVVVGAPLLAVLSTQVSRRVFLLATIALYALANLASAAAPTFTWLLLLRFLSGLPHGAYFGVACLTAASRVPLTQRARATAHVMLGFTVGTIVGVPLANSVGRELGWRWAFVVVGALAAACALGVWRWAPREARADAGANWRRELRALQTRQVWLTLAIGAIGQGGIFSIFSFLTPALERGAHAPATALPLALMLFGVGMSLGVWCNGWLADRYGTDRAITLCLLWSLAAMSCYALASGHTAAMLASLLLVGGAGGLATTVQTRLMAVAGEAQTMAAALNHAAFNVANALGPALGGAALAAGYGWSSTGWVGTLLAGLGLVIAQWARRDSSARTAAATA